MRENSLKVERSAIVSEIDALQRSITKAAMAISLHQTPAQRGADLSESAQTAVENLRKQSADSDAKIAELSERLKKVDAKILAENHRAGAAQAALKDIRTRKAECVAL